MMIIKSFILGGVLFLTTCFVKVQAQNVPELGTRSVKTEVNKAKSSTTAKKKEAPTVGNKSKVMSSDDADSSTTSDSKPALSTKGKLEKKED